MAPAAHGEAKKVQLAQKTATASQTQRHQTSGAVHQAHAACDEAHHVHTCGKAAGERGRLVCPRRAGPRLLSRLQGGVEMNPMRLAGRGWWSGCRPTMRSTATAMCRRAGSRARHSVGGSEPAAAQAEARAPRRAQRGGDGGAGGAADGAWLHPAPSACANMKGITHIVNLLNTLGGTTNFRIRCY